MAPNKQLVDKKKQLSQREKNRMEINVFPVSLEEFNQIAEQVHRAVFQDERPASMNKFDYALLCETPQKELTAYATILEHDAESAYMQHGGALTKNSLLTVKSYFLMIEWLKKKYPVITTRIFNDNIAMLNMAMRAGLRIHGVEYYKETPNFKGGILLCLNLEKGEVN